MNRIAACLALLASTITVPAIAGPAYVYGPAPDWVRYKELAEPAVRAKIAELAAKGKMAGPEHWTIQWPHGYAQAGWRHKGRFNGYLSCAMLVATTPQAKGRNIINFVAVVDYDKVLTIDISDRYSNSLVNVMCQDAISRGFIPPASIMEQQAQTRTLPAIGLKIRLVPEGVSIIEVTPGSAAERSGLRSGQVISHADGIALASLGTTVANILESSAAPLQLRTTGGQTIELKRAP